MRGLISATASKPSPSRSAASTRILWNRTSAPAISRARAARPSGRLRSMASIRLLRLLLTNNAPPASPRDVAFQRLDLDDIGAEVGEELARIGAEHDGADLYDPDSIEQRQHHPLLRIFVSI